MHAKPSTPPIVRACQTCGTAFRCWPSQIAKGGGKHCSTACYHTSRAVTPEQRREYKKLNARKHTATRDTWRAAHAQQVAEGKLRWQQANPDRTRESGKRYRARLRAEMLAAYGGKCACCGETEPTFLTLDHAQGDGAQHRRQYKQKGNGGVLAELCKAGWPQDGRFRLLCWNCQFGTQQPGGCPHQRQTQ